MDNKNFVMLNIALLTISDSRTPQDDTSGDLLKGRLQAAGHRCAARELVPDNIYDIRAQVGLWIADNQIDIVLSTGGTGVTGRDGTPEAIKPLLDKEIEGFGESFRMLSYQEIASSTLQSRALSGVANGTYLFVLPGSPHACATAWDNIIQPQLDIRTRPCNLAMLIPRLKE